MGTLQTLTELQKTLNSRDPTYLSQIVEQYEADIETLLSFNDEALPLGIDKADMVTFRNHFLSGAFRCRYRGCSEKTNLAFQSIAAREKHESSHLPQFQCPKSYCIWKDMGFRKKQELESHMRHYHPDPLDNPVPEIPRSLPMVTTAGSDATLDTVHIPEVGNELVRL